MAIWTVQELAAQLKCHQTTIYRLLNKGEIPGFRVGYDWRFESGAIEAWMKAGGYPPDRERTNYDLDHVRRGARGSLLGGKR